MKLVATKLSRSPIKPRVKHMCLLFTNPMFKSDKGRRATNLAFDEISTIKKQYSRNSPLFIFNKWVHGRKPIHLSSRKLTLAKPLIRYLNTPGCDNLYKRYFPSSHRSLSI